jgi:hypothetical protein
VAGLGQDLVYRDRDRQEIRFILLGGNGVTGR